MIVHIAGCLSEMCKVLREEVSQVCCINALAEASTSGVEGKGRIFSANAYMLLYRRKTHHPAADVPADAVPLSDRCVLL